MDYYESTPLLPKQHVREKYYVQLDGSIIATTSKAGCTSVKLATPGGIQMRIPIEEAAKRRNKVEILLYIRHPLDRLVSAWKYFTGSMLMPCTYATVEDRVALNSEPSFDRWARIAMRYNDEHWTSQVDYHTLDGLFVPNRVLPLEKMGGEIHNRTSHAGWLTYYTDWLEEELRERYRKDLVLWYYSSTEED